MFKLMLIAWFCDRRYLVLKLVTNLLWKVKVWRSDRLAYLPLNAECAAMEASHTLTKHWHEPSSSDVFALRLFAEYYHLRFLAFYWLANHVVRTVDWHVKADIAMHQSMLADEVLLIAKGERCPHGYENPLNCDLCEPHKFNCPCKYCRPCAHGPSEWDCEICRPF